MLRYVLKERDSAFVSFADEWMFVCRYLELQANRYDGVRVESHDFAVTEEVCRNRRRDFFMRYFIDLPARIYDGDYTLKLTIEDLKGQTSGEATIAFKVTERLRLTAGYTFVYWSQVVRPGDQIDLDLNPNLFPPEAMPFSGPLRPRFTWRESDFWAQGVSAGVDYRW